MNINQLDIIGREFSPFDAPFYVLCEDIILAGDRFKFGDPVPEFIDLMHLTHHFQNGVIGTLKELKFIKTPIELSLDDPLGPIARFVSHHSEVSAEVKEKEESGGDFSIENAKLLKGKKDICGYAKTFGIKLKIASNINIEKMINKLEEEAIKKGLIEDPEK